MSKAGTQKKPRRKIHTFDELFKPGKLYQGCSLYFDPDFRAAGMKTPPARKRSKIIVTTRTFKEMPNGDLIMEVSRHTEPAPKDNATGIDPADIQLYTDRSGRLHIRPAGKRAARQKQARV